MKKINLFLGVIALIALAGCLMFACSDGSGSGSDSDSFINGWEGQGGKSSGGGGGGPPAGEPTEISSVVITGVAVPTAGSVAAKTAQTTTAGISSATVAWYSGNTEYPNVRFGSNSTYKAKITLVVRSGYSLSTSLTATVNGAAGTVDTDNNKVIWYEFSPTGALDAGMTVSAVDYASDGSGTVTIDWWDAAGAGVSVATTSFTFSEDAPSITPKFYDPTPPTVTALTGDYVGQYTFPVPKTITGSGTLKVTNTAGTPAVTVIKAVTGGSITIGIDNNDGTITAAGSPNTAFSGATTFSWTAGGSSLPGDTSTLSPADGSMGTAITATIIGAEGYWLGSTVLSTSLTPYKVGSEGTTAGSSVTIDKTYGTNGTVVKFTVASLADHTISTMPDITGGSKATDTNADYDFTITSNAFNSYKDSNNTIIVTFYWDEA